MIRVGGKVDLILVGLAIAFVIWLYFRSNPLNHSKAFMLRRFINWFPLGMSYAFLYMARYNLNVAKNALGEMMTKEDFGYIFAAGTIVYGCSFLITGPIVDKIGGKKGILIALVGSCLANILEGVVTFMFLHGQLKSNLMVTFAVLYSINMFFQSYGAVSTIKVKAHWFHVRERGTFGAIFGTLISFGVYLAFDWGQAIVDASKAGVRDGWVHKLLQTLFAVESNPMDAIWFVFFVPAIILVLWTVLDVVLIRDTPSHAGHEDFDTHDASSGEMEKELSVLDLLKRVFLSPIMITISLIEFCAGVVRNGIMQWYPTFAHEVKQPGAEIFLKHWGLFLCLTGIAGGFLVGFLSDRWFHSRRGPPAVFLYAAITVSAIVMAFNLNKSPFAVGMCAVLMSLFIIGVHAIMSGTAAADFGGRKAAATAAGITDGFVYLGSGLQSAVIGKMVHETGNWIYWPTFIIPFAFLGMIFAMRMWRSLPDATRKYLATVEKVDLDKRVSSQTVTTRALTEG